MTTTFASARSASSVSYAPSRRDQNHRRGNEFRDGQENICHFKPESSFLTKRELIPLKVLPYKTAVMVLKDLHRKPCHSKRLAELVESYAKDTKMMNIRAHGQTHCNAATSALHCLLHLQIELDAFRRVHFEILADELRERIHARLQRYAEIYDALGPWSSSQVTALSSTCDAIEASWFMGWRNPSRSRVWWT